MKLEFLKSSELSVSEDYIKEDLDSNFKMIDGSKSMFLSQGRANFSALKIFAKPNSEVFFKVTTDRISRYFAEFFDTNNYFTHGNIGNEYAYIFSIRLRDCRKGEIFVQQINRYCNIKFLKFIHFLYPLFSCSKCDFGKYSLSDPKTTTNCKTCPLMSSCPGGAQISLDNGY